LVEILAQIIVQFEDKNEAIQFLEKTEAKVKSSSEAVALCKVLSGQILLEHLADQERTKVNHIYNITWSIFSFLPNLKEN
jgi:26S proteasome regulatory subunit N9